MKRCCKIVCTIGLLIFAFETSLAGSPQQQPKRKTRNVVLIVVDGLRWQELVYASVDEVYRRRWEDTRQCPQHGRRAAATRKAAALSILLMAAIDVTPDRPMRPTVLLIA